LTTTVGEAVDALAGRLAAAGVPDPRVDAELLACHALGWSRTRLRTGRAEPLTEPGRRRLDGFQQRRAHREPLQLIVGTIGFRHLELEVRPGVFIPRPETEVLAGEAAARTPAGGVVVEPCTGSGAVACALAQETGARQVIATDRSPAAVNLATANAARCGVRVTILQGDLLDPLPSDLRGRIDVLVSNPPYVAEAEVADLEPEVSRWDPREALVSGPTGHEVSDRLVGIATEWLRPGGWLLLEVADTRAAEAAERAAAAGLTEAAVVRDLAGRDRIVVARR
jgi:release factor glutamine methyltransferase